MREGRKCIVVKCGGCKRVVYTAVNRPEVMTPDRLAEIGEMILEGCTVDHVTVEEVRASGWECTCNTEPVTTNPTQ